MKDLGKLQEAEISIRKAIELNPNFAEAYLNLGSILSDLGNLQEAETYTRQAIKLNPNSANAHSNLGNILRDLDKLKEAEISTRKAIELNPTFAEAHSNLGNILRDLGKLKEAEKSYRKAIEIDSKFLNAYYNLGNILKDLGKLKEAEKSYRKAIEIDSKFLNAYYNLGKILKDLGKLQESEISYRKSIEIKPDFAEAYSNLGNVLKVSGKSQEAEKSYRKAIKIKPDFAEAHSNLGSTLLDLGKFKEAELSTRKAIQIKPDLADAHYNLGITLRDISNFDDAINHFNQAIKLNNQLSIAKGALIETKCKICDWNDQDIQNIWLKNLGIEGPAVSPFGLFYYEDNPLNHLKRSKKFYKERYIRPTKKIKSSKKNIINIGYFSSDFRDHVVSHTFIRTLELHNKYKFKIFAYSLNNIDDNYTKRVKDAVFCFRETKLLSDLDIVKLARNDNLDIAVDLNGYTENNRSSIFSYRVAPIQINYLGYSGSTGSDSLDYILADKVLIPHEHKKFYTEKVLYLPNSAFPYDNTKEFSKNKFSREVLGLPKDGFVFACFNSIQKISRKEFKIWMNLLQKVEGSVLWLLKPNKTAIRNLYSELTDYRIDKDRIIFAEYMQLDDHLSRHCYADLFLDTFNFNAAATASLALSTGRPIVTLLGKSYSARMAASILSACNLNELITHNYSEYESIAYTLATNNEKLKEIYQKLINKKEISFFNSHKFTSELESVYNNIYNY